MFLEIPERLFVVTEGSPAVIVEPETDFTVVVTGQAE